MRRSSLSQKTNLWAAIDATECLTTDKPLKIEQRLYPRCSPSEAEFRVFSHDTKIVGQLVNICQKGIFQNGIYAFNYLK
jgi:hypothetical protein